MLVCDSAGYGFSLLNLGFAIAPDLICQGFTSSLSVDGFLNVWCMCGLGFLQRKGFLLHNDVFRPSFATISELDQVLAASFTAEQPNGYIFLKSSCLPVSVQELFSMPDLYKHTRMSIRMLRLTRSEIPFVSALYGGVVSSLIPSFLSFSCMPMYSPPPSEWTGGNERDLGASQSEHPTAHAGTLEIYKNVPDTKKKRRL
ncbi:hypothetical protein NDN08_007332 [Rhodosorus marinus]|uniref:Uncharacterized protein n=1 Tax=Rhodosorus marinus TaxID=101924 RepID=A0AAV8UJG5_9RHOD|nr:hypothetical protein NDN08_007332 [Rhodosorus marinus]